jgi:hypothetical protein
MRWDRGLRGLDFGLRLGDLSLLQLPYDKIVSGDMGQHEFYQSGRIYFIKPRDSMRAGLHTGGQYLQAGTAPVLP